MSIVIVNNSFFNVFEKKSLNHLQILVFVHIFASEFYLLVRERNIYKIPLYLIYIIYRPVSLYWANQQTYDFSFNFSVKNIISGSALSQKINSYRLTNMLRWQNLK